MWVEPESNTILYFAYGSNMDKKQMESRVGARYVGVAKLTDHRVVFNKRSKDGTGKANIASDKPGGPGVWGSVFELNNEQLKKLKTFEQGYFLRKGLRVTMSSGELKQVALFCAEPGETKTLGPSAEYLEKIINAAKNLPPEYQETLKGLAQSGPSEAYK